MTTLSLLHVTERVCFVTKLHVREEYIGLTIFEVNLDHAAVSSEQEIAVMSNEVATLVGLYCEVRVLQHVHV